MQREAAGVGPASNLAGLARRPETPDEELLGAEAQVSLSEISDETRLERMRAELAMGFRELAGESPAVSVFGSARTPPGTQEYELAREVGRRLGEAGFAVITGGGPGAMEAAHRGAREAGARSIALNIDLPFEQPASGWVDLSLDFHYFFCRKVMFVRFANAFVVLPGGYGTLDELFEALCLIQTEKIRSFPVILTGTAYWSGLVTWLRDRTLGEGKISARDLDLLHVTDDLDEIVERVQRAAAQQQAGSPPDNT
ncbi:MAG: TIGR00730 family Rossman fold protein [Actinomycetota bacterium]|nr:TIGR00730 family Rossman fold protein [Actinomycetota bacterium]